MPDVAGAPTGQEDRMPRDKSTPGADRTQERAPGSARPSEAMKKLANLLVGRWNITGDAQGETRYESAEGGHFLLQHVRLDYAGRRIEGMEVLGHLHPLERDPTDEVWTRFYSYRDGLTLDYVYEMEGDVLTIWFKNKGSDNFYRGHVSKDKKTIAGAWQWPGGGYKTVLTRVA
jgi:hypothetical protein